MINRWLFLLSAVFFSSVVLTGFFKNYAIKSNFVDTPNNRSSHSLPTPTSGGLSIAVVFLAGIIILKLFGRIEVKEFLALMGGGLIIAGVGFLDDKRHVPAQWRILVHFLAAGWVLFWLGKVPPLDLGFVVWDWGWFGNVLAIVGLVWLLNLYNFMDGIDGIAATEAVFVSASAILLTMAASNFVLVLGIFMAGVAGFLVWNLPPAKIFMGDMGSGFIGLMLGAIIIFSTQKGLLPLWCWVILLGFFIVDATTTLVRRALAGERLYEAHCNHAYQNAARHLRSHGKVVLIITVTNILWLFPLALLVSRSPRDGFLLTVVAFIPLVLLVLYLNGGKRSEKRSSF